MRRFALAAMVVAMAQGAYAADLPILRGSYVEPTFRSYTKWEGLYVGGHVGYSTHNFDFTKTTQGLQKSIMQNTVLESVIGDWTLMGTADVRATGFGGFVGYNWQWEDAVIGIEANYTHFSGQKNATSSGSIPGIRVVNPPGSTPPPGHSDVYDISLSGTSSARVNDLISLRARGGWAFGSFMPYGFAGLTAGIIDINRSVAISYDYYDLYNVTVGTASIPRYDLIASVSGRTRSENQKSLVTFGFNAGFGFEYLVMPNIFLRAEYEYTQLPLAKDTIIQLNTGRVGVGAKF